MENKASNFSGTSSLESLEHARQCKDSKCAEKSCQNMKEFLEHLKVCKKRKTCVICKQLIAICRYHAKSCRSKTCLLPFCYVNRQKLIELERFLTQQRKESSTPALPTARNSAKELPFFDIELQLLNLECMNIFDDDIDMD